MLDNREFYFQLLLSLGVNVPDYFEKRRFQIIDVSQLRRIRLTLLWQRVVECVYIKSDTHPTRMRRGYGKFGDQVIKADENIHNRWNRFCGNQGM